MFDRVNLDIALGERGGAVRFGNVFDARLNFRLAFQVHAPKTDAGIGWRRQELHVHTIAAVQAGAGEFHGMIQGVLV